MRMNRKVSIWKHVRWAIRRRPQWRVGDRADCHVHRHSFARLELFLGSQCTFKFRHCADSLKHQPSRRCGDPDCLEAYERHIRRTVLPRASRSSIHGRGINRRPWAC